MAYVTVAMPIGLALMTFYFLIETFELIGKARSHPQ
jgi:TRAP-type C4-dicarboxylate transport system permease small subunit